MIALLAALTLTAPAPRIHCTSDISHEFTFYMDGRFFQQYVGSENGADARNWGTLHKLDLANTNLLALCSGKGPVRYSAKTIRHVSAYVRAGGAALILSDAAGVANKRDLPIEELAAAFGASFSSDPATPPAAATGRLKAPSITLRAGGTLELKPGWDTLVVDAQGRPLMARRPEGRGTVIVAVRGLFGHQPDASDPINAEWIKPLLQDAVRAKPVDAAKPPAGQFAEMSHKIGPLTVEYNEGTQPFADAIAREYAIVRAKLVEITGVEPSKGTLTSLLMLPTGGGGFSSGDRIGIGAWWGGFPANRYPMIELIGHEAAHSWVLPYAEPTWNEPIATYLGIQVGKRLGLAEAQQTLDRTIAAARKLDPDMNRIDITAADAPRDAIWGKAFWIFEQIEKRHGPGTMAKYFQAKRRLLSPGRSGYSFDDCVAVWSEAVGNDLFPFFRSTGIAVDPARASVERTAR